MGEFIVLKVIKTAGGSTIFSSIGALEMAMSVGRSVGRMVGPFDLAF